MKPAAQRQVESLNGVAARVLSVMSFGSSDSVSAICTELFRNGSRVDFNIVQGCLRALVSSGHAKETSPGCFARTTVASGDEPPPQKTLRVVHPQPEQTMPLPAHVAKGIAESHMPETITEREPLRDIGALAGRLRQSGRDLLMWAEDLERLALEFESRVDAAKQSGAKFAQLQALLKSLAE